MGLTYTFFKLKPWQFWVLAISLSAFASIYIVFKPLLIPTALGEFSFLSLVFLCLFWSHKNSSYIVATAITAAIIIGDIFNYSGKLTTTEMLSDSAIILALWVVAYFVWRFKHLQIRMDTASSRLTDIWDTVVDGMILIDSVGTINAANPACEKLFGYEHHELLGKNIKMLMPPKYSEKHDGYLSTYMKTKKAEVVGSGREVQGLKKDGSIFPLHLAVSETHIDGQLCFTGIVRDMTVEVSTYAIMQEAKEEAERANAAKSDFLSAMSHELRTPMNAVLGFAQILQMDEENPLTDRQKTAIDHVVQSGDHLLTLINDVLNLAKIESGAMEVEIENTNTAHILDECEMMISAIASKYNVTLNLETSARQDHYVLADPLRLRQVILNLLSNAVKYNRKGGHVSVSCSLHEGVVRISIADTGIGIAPSKAKKIFEPFTRVHNEKLVVEGTGIGLSISQELVQLMDGHLDFTSSEKGSTFWVDLPHSDEINVIESPVVRKSLISDTLENTQASLLYIEDNPSNIMLMEHMLDRLDGIFLDTSPTAELGINMAQENGYNLILMDINLPGMSGLQAFEILRNDPRTNKVPVVAITADVTLKQQKRIRELGFDGYVSKPINIAATLKMIERHTNTALTEGQKATKH